jgi:hypothetical protein
MLVLKHKGSQHYEYGRYMRNACNSSNLSRFILNQSIVLINQGPGGYLPLIKTNSGKRSHANVPLKVLSSEF